MAAGRTALLLFTLSPVLQAELNTDPATWEGWLNSGLMWAATQPWTFLSYVLLILSPCFCLSAVLSWKLSKQIEAAQQKKRQKKD